MHCVVTLASHLLTRRVDGNRDLSAAVCLVALGLLVCAHPLSAQTPQSPIFQPPAVCSYDLPKCQELANSGDAGAQFMIGQKFDQGEGVDRDVGEAMRWYRLAAEQGHVDSQINLAAPYYSGQTCQGRNKIRPGGGGKLDHLAAGSRL